MAMSADRYDLAVLGAGSGGLAAAQRAARHGARVALFEPGRLGGTCVHLGCVPKKAMWLAAQAADQVLLARGIGFPVSAGDLDWPAFIARRSAYIERARAGYLQRLADLGIDLFAAAARLADGERVESAAGDVRARHRLIATGGRPQRLGLPGFALGMVSDDVFSLRAPPRRLAIVGSGYIAVEMAGLLHALGVDVTVLVRGSCVLGHFDPEIGQALTAAMRARGIEIRCGVLVGALERADDGSLRVQCQNGDVLEGYDQLLWALGRVPNSEGLGLEDVGVDTTDSGHVRIDARQDTSAGNIHAVGDVVAGQPALTPVAIAAGRHLADRLFGGRPEATLDLAMVPTVAFSTPPVASCGLSEPQARRAHGDAVQVFSGQFLPMRESLAGRDERVFIKLVCAGPDQRVLGLHMLGPGVDEILQGFAVALRIGATLADFHATVAIHPTSAEEVVLLGA
jgi:glutathione reductase (NADPH)